MPIIFVVSFILYAKKNYNEPDGGPCSYKDTYYPAIIQSIEIEANYPRDFIMLVLKEESVDTVYFSDIANHYQYENELQNVKVNDTITYIVSEIESGSCTPTIFSIDFSKKY